MSQGKLNAYNKINVHGELDVANPHRIIQLLFERAVERLLQAKAYAQQENMLKEKQTALEQAIEIVAHLQGCLNFEKGAEISVNLDRLYNYVIEQIGKAYLQNEIQCIDNSVIVLREIKSGWDGIMSA